MRLDGDGRRPGVQAPRLEHMDKAEFEELTENSAVARKHGSRYLDGELLSERLSHDLCRRRQIWTLTFGFNRTLTFGFKRFA
jgi:hypothetical protein